MIRILIADDHAMVRAGLSQLLRQYDDLEIVGEAANGLEAVEQVSLLEPHLVLMDMSMPIMDGLEALKLVKQRNPDTHVVVLSTFQEPRQVSAALTSGASGYLVKDVEPCRAEPRSARRSRPVCCAVRHRQPPPPRSQPGTPRRSPRVSSRS
jgi:DNA-binding NarL/FixJ family response regulator